MERVILFLLAHVLEKLPAIDRLFSPHPRTEQGKLLWRDGQAVGFYTFKQKGVFVWVFHQREKNKHRAKMGSYVLKLQLQNII